MSKIVYKKYSVYSKDLSTLFLVLFWLVLGFIVCFIGINNVFAASYDVNNFTAQIYDNVNGTLTSKNTYKETDFYYSLDVNYASYSSGGAWGVSSPIPLIANHTYSMTVDPTVIGCGFTILSTVNRLGVGTSLSNAVTSYQNNTNVNEKFSQSVSNSKYLQFVFTPTINSSYIVFPFSTTSSCQGRESQLSSIVIEDLGESGISQDQINTSLNNQTNELNNSIQNSTNTITGEINDMEQSIIDSNKETQDVIKDQFNTCRPSKNLFNAQSWVNSGNNSNYYTYINNGFIITSVDDRGLSRFTENDKIILPNGTYTFSNYGNAGLRIYNNDTDFPLVNQPTFEVTLGYIYVKFVSNERLTIQPMLVKGSSPSEFEPYGEEICTNKLDDTNDKLNDLNNSLNNSNSSGATNDASNFFSNFTTDTFGLTSIITAPLSLINSITSSSCSTLRLPLPYLENKYLELPCMNTIYTRYFGSFFNIYQTITFGIVAYWVIVRIFNQVKDFKNPDHDEIEVLDL